MQLLPSDVLGSEVTIGGGCCSRLLFVHNLKVLDFPLLFAFTFSCIMLTSWIVQAGISGCHGVLRRNGPAMGGCTVRSAVRGRTLQDLQPLLLLWKQL